MTQRLRAWIERWFHSRITECTLLRVRSVRHLTPHMLRVSFSGQNLEPFDTTENLHVKLLLPPPGAMRDHWLVMSGDGKARLRGKGIEPIFRKYTIRSIDPAIGHIDVDFVLHADSGPGAAWASSAQLGDVVGMIGPGGRGLVSADWYLLAGDETGLPAIGRMLENLPREARGTILVEVGGPEEEQSLDPPPLMDLRWLYRGTSERGTTSLLVDAVLNLDWPEPDCRIFASVAGEFGAVQAICTHFKRDRNLDKSRS